MFAMLQSGQKSEISQIWLPAMSWAQSPRPADAGAGDTVEITPKPEKMHCLSQRWERGGGMPGRPRTQTDSVKRKEASWRTRLEP